MVATILVRRIYRLPAGFDRRHAKHPTEKSIVSTCRSSRYPTKRAVLDQHLAVDASHARPCADRRSDPSARPTCWCRRSPGTSGRARGGRCRPSSRRAVSSRWRDRCPVLVPIPSSPRKRAPAIGARAPPADARSPTSRVRRHHLAVLERELDARHVDSAPVRRHVEADRAVGRVLVRAREDLAARHVAAPVRVDPGPPLDVQPQVGAGRLDVDLTRRREPLDHARLRARAARAQAATGSGWSRNSARSTKSA